MKINTKVVEASFTTELLFCIFFNSTEVVQGKSQGQA